MEPQLQHQSVYGRQRPKKHRGWQSGSGGGGGRVRTRENGGGLSQESRLWNGFVSERNPGDRVQVVAEEARREATPTVGSRPAGQQGVRRYQSSPNRTSRNGRRQRPRQVQRNHPDTSPPTLPPTTTSMDSGKETNILKEHPKLSCSVDSGRGEELSSSCESSFEPTQIAVHTTCSQSSRHSSCSDFDNEDDVFEDALSNLPTKDEDGFTSSAFVTPDSTRSQSPAILPSSDDPILSEVPNILPLEEVCSSLERVKEERERMNATNDESRQESMSNHVATPAEDSSGHLTSHVTLNPPPLSPTPLRDALENPVSTRLDAAVFYIGEVELNIGASSDHVTEDLTFEFQCCPPSNKSDTSCSTTTSGSLSPAKNSLQVHSGVPPHPFLTVDTSRHPLPKHHSFCSLSTASPQSSICSQSSSHPPSPSPSPSSHCGEEDKHTSEKGQIDLASLRTHSPPSHGPGMSQTDGLFIFPSSCADCKAVEMVEEGVKTKREAEEEKEEEEQEEGMDEWPDLGGEFSLQPHFVGGGPETGLAKDQTAVPCVSQTEVAPNIMQWFASVVAPPNHAPCPAPMPPTQFIHPAAIHYMPMAGGVHLFASNCTQMTNAGGNGSMNYPAYFPQQQLPQQQQQQQQQLPQQQQQQLLQQQQLQQQQQQQPDSGNSCTSWSTFEDTTPPLGPPPVLEAQPQDTTPPLGPPPVLEAQPQEPAVATTVDAPSDQLCSYPLHTTWVMWYDKVTGSHRNKLSDYKNSLKCLSTIDNVEDFWRLYNNVLAPSELENNTNYHFFKDGIQPLWEDDANKNGGKWVLTVRDSETLDRTWMELLMALIGEHMDKSNLVNGAVVSRRKKGDRIALWTCRRDRTENLHICKEFVKVLVLGCNILEPELPKFVRRLAEGKGGLTLVYMHHSDSLKSKTSYQNDVRISLRDHVETILESL